MKLMKNSIFQVVKNTTKSTMEIILCKCDIAWIKLYLEAITFNTSPPPKRRNSAYLTSENELLVEGRIQPLIELYPNVCPHRVTLNTTHLGVTVALVNARSP